MSDLDNTPENLDTNPAGENTPETPEIPSTPAHKPKVKQMAFHVLDDGNIKATFGENVEPLTLALPSVPEQVQLAAITEGLISRARSYTSKLIDAERTPEKLREVIAKAFANLQAGVWKQERGEGTSEFSLEVEAAFAFKKARAAKKGEEFAGTLETVNAEWGTLSDEQKKMVKSIPLYQSGLAQLKAERAAKVAEKLAAKAEEAGEANFF